MLNAPFGTIKIIADGIMLDYEAVLFFFKSKPPKMTNYDHFRRQLQILLI